MTSRINKSSRKAIISVTCQYQSSWARSYPDIWTAETDWPDSDSSNRPDNEGPIVCWGIMLGLERFQDGDTAAGKPVVASAAQRPATSYHTCFQNKQ